MQQEVGNAGGQADWMRRAGGFREATLRAASRPSAFVLGAVPGRSPGAAGPGADADQGTAADGRVLVEDRLATDRIHRAVGREHAMGHPAAKPEAVLRRPGSRCRPCGAKRPSPSAIFARAFHSIRVTYARVTCGPRTISSPISPARQFLDFVDRADRTIDDADHFPANAARTAGRRTRRRPSGSVPPFRHALRIHCRPSACNSTPTVCPTVSPSTSLAEMEATGRDSVAP